MSSVGVVIATYGVSEWEDWATLAEASVLNQSIPADQLIKCHRRTLMEARNAGVLALETEWAIILDADDALDHYYVASMLAAKGTLRYPKILKLEDGKRRMIEHRMGDLMQGNFICIGAMFRVEDFKRVGGFWDEPIWEDWSLWLRMWKAGADVQPSLAIYIQNVRNGSRNEGGTQEFNEHWLTEIRRRAETMNLGVPEKEKLQ